MYLKRFISWNNNNHNNRDGTSCLRDGNTDSGVQSYYIVN